MALIPYASNHLYETSLISIKEETSEPESESKEEETSEPESESKEEEKLD